MLANKNSLIKNSKAIKLANQSIFEVQQTVDWLGIFSLFGPLVIEVVPVKEITLEIKLEISN